MRLLSKIVLLLGMTCLVSVWGADAHAQAYEELRAEAESLRVSSAKARAGGTMEIDEVRGQLQAKIEALFVPWLGSTWGLGAPQSSTPGEGKINCGTFVGIILVHAGFNVDHRRLQRQPVEHIIETFSSGKDIRRFRRASMEDFLAGVRKMGPGLYIIGLDFHVGFVVVTKDDVRFVHASYETFTVVDEPAATAMPIVTSRYRVVGKLLDDAMIQNWLREKRIKVIGNW